MPNIFGDDLCNIVSIRTYEKVKIKVLSFAFMVDVVSTSESWDVALKEREHPIFGWCSDNRFILSRDYIFNPVIIYDVVYKTHGTYTCIKLPEEIAKLGKGDYILVHKNQCVVLES